MPRSQIPASLLREGLEHLSGTAVLEMDDDGKVFSCLGRFFRTRGYPRGMVGVVLPELLDRASSTKLVEALAEREEREMVLQFREGALALLAVDCRLFCRGDRFFLFCQARLVTEGEAFEKMTRLNNQLADLTRETARRNRGLARSSRVNEELAERDALTELLNRRGLERAFVRLSEDVSVFGVIMADIDHFKRVNDLFGHDRGDEVLKAFAGALVGGARKEDVVCRWGGEEFLLLVPGARMDVTFQVAERIRKDLQALSWLEGPKGITASFGVVLLREGMTLQETVDAADRALYEAKNAGRNRTVCSGVSNAT